MVQEITLDINKVFAKRQSLVQLRVGELGEQIKVNLKDRGVPIPYDLQKSVRLVGRYPNNTAYYGEPLRMGADSSVTIEVTQEITKMHGNWKSAYIEVYDALPSNGTFTKTSDFKNKIAGSYVQNSALGQYTGATAPLDTPPTNVYNEFTQNHYDTVMNPDDNLVMSAIKSGTGVASQLMFSLDLVTELEKTVPDKFKFAPSIELKVAVAESILKNLKFTIRSMAYITVTATGALVNRTAVLGTWLARQGTPQWSSQILTTLSTQGDYSTEVDFMNGSILNQTTGKAYFMWRTGTATDTTTSKLSTDYVSWSYELDETKFKSITTQDFMLAVEEAGNSVNNVQNWYYNLGLLNQQLADIMADGALGSYTQMQTTVNRLLSYRNHQRDIQLDYGVSLSGVALVGKTGLEITHTLPSATTPYISLRYVESLIDNNDYVFKCKVKLITNVDPTRDIRIGLRAGGFNDRNVTINKNDYIDIVVPFKYIKDISSIPRIIISSIINTGSSFKYEIKDVSITDGTIEPQDWSPAFKDYLTIQDATATFAVKSPVRTWITVPLLSGFTGGLQYRIVNEIDGRISVELRGRVITSTNFTAQTQIQVSTSIPGAVQNHVQPITSYTNVPVTWSTGIAQTNGTLYLIVGAQTTNVSFDGFKYYTTN